MAEGAFPESRRGSARSRRVRFGETDEDDQVLVYVHEIPSRYSPLDDVTNNWSLGTSQKKEKLNDSLYSDSDSEHDSLPSASHMASHTASTSQSASQVASNVAAETPLLNPALAAVVISTAPIGSFSPKATPIYPPTATLEESSSSSSKSRQENNEESVSKNKSSKSRRKSERRRSRQESRRESLTGSGSNDSINISSSSTSSNSTANSNTSGGKLLAERNEMHDIGRMSPTTELLTPPKPTTPVSNTNATSPPLRDSGLSAGQASQPLASVTFTPISPTFMSAKSLPKLRIRPNSARTHVINGLAAPKSVGTSQSEQSADATYPAEAAFGASQLSKTAAQNDGPITRVSSAPSRWLQDPFDRNGYSSVYGGAKSSLGFLRDSGSSSAYSWQRSFSWQVANSYASTVSAPAVHVQQLFDDFYK